MKTTYATLELTSVAGVALTPSQRTDLLDRAKAMGVRLAIRHYGRRFTAHSSWSVRIPGPIIFDTPFEAGDHVLSYLARPATAPSERGTGWGAEEDH